MSTFWRNVQISFVLSKWQFDYYCNNYPYTLTFKKLITHYCVIGSLKLLKRSSREVNLCFRISRMSWRMLSSYCYRFMFDEQLPVWLSWKRLVINESLYKRVLSILAVGVGASCSNSESQAYNPRCLTHSNVRELFLYMLFDRYLDTPAINCMICYHSLFLYLMRVHLSAKNPSLLSLIEFILLELRISKSNYVYNLKCQSHI